MSPTSTQAIIRVLIVDDSAFVRKVVKEMLSRSPFIEVVGTAHNGEEALEMTARLAPDVVTLDLMMPDMDGVEFLRRQMAVRPLPVVVCSIAHESGELALAAMDAGAVEFVQKPTALATARVYDVAEELIGKVKAAAQVRIARVMSPAAAVAAGPATSPSSALRSAQRADIVVLGISTGGPQALRYLVPRLPADFPVPIVVVLHMPVGYTEMYAGRLNELSALEVVEARDGDLLRAGAVFIAPAGRHLTFVRRDDGSVRCHLDLRPLDTPHRPAVDVLFRSAADTFGARVLGVVMTGMGDDGLVGSAHIKALGGRVVTESESSCVVYGMPRAVVEAALSDRQATLEEMSAVITGMV
ncbi:MAG TPA: chemotaxis response regulator protein-glutamate methylesterase [Longimicrobiales bacterium]